MPSLSDVQRTIQSQIPDAQVFIKDMGGGDHLEAVVISPAFADKTMVKQHQMVYSALKAELASEAIHALALKTYTPDQWSEAGQPT